MRKLTLYEIKAEKQIKASSLNKRKGYETATELILQFCSMIDFILIYNLNSKSILIELKGMNLDHDFNVVVGKQRRTDNAQTGHPPIQYLYINQLMFFYYLFNLSQS